MIPEWLPVLITNYTTIMGDFWTWTTKGYITSIGLLFYPIFLGGIIGYIYTKQQSVVAAAVTILVLVTALTGLFTDDIILMFLHLLVALIISGLFLMFVIKVRGR